MALLSRQYDNAMTLGDADALLGQWAEWASDDTKTGVAIGAWQRDYRPSFDPDNASDARRYGSLDEETMLRVDGSLARLGHTDANNAHILRARYRLGYQFIPMHLDHALRRFIAVFELTD